VKIITQNNPSFLGLGVEKSATSWIFACLYEHPEICIPVKEINFFWEDEKWNKGIRFYQNFFQERCPNAMIQGEFSTSYFYHSVVASRINQYLPKIKLLVCLRNPVDRAYSNYRNDIMAGTIPKTLDFHTALKSKEYYLGQGHYKKQFTEYFKHFSKDQFYIMIYEDIAKNPKKFIQQLFRFLEVDETFIPSSLSKKINVSRTPGNVKLEGTTNRIATILHESKWGNGLWWLLKKSGVPGLLRKINTDQSPSEGMPPDLRNELNLLFKEDKVYTERLLNRSLPWS